MTFVRTETTLERLNKYTMPEPNSGCWIWLGTLTADGYGSIFVNGRAQRAHRVSYETLRAPIPAGLHIDHLCRVRCCVNPDHLEPVTSGENTRRGITGVVNASRQRAKTHCPHGHPYSGDNLLVRVNGSRRCVTCKRRVDKDRNDQRPSAIRARQAGGVK